jgi:TRAP-type uncharacterized transport system fused permease subunit
LSTKRRALALTAATALAGGIYRLSPYGGSSQQSLTDWVLVALGLFWLFLWLHADRQEFGHRRSPWMNVGIVMLSLVFIPIYLAKTRPPGRKLAAVGWFFLLLLGWFALNLLGALIGYFIFGGSAAYHG